MNLFSCFFVFIEGREPFAYDGAQREHGLVIFADKEISHTCKCPVMNTDGDCESCKAAERFLSMTVFSCRFGKEMCDMKLGIAGTGTIVKEILPLFRGWGIEPAALCGTPRSKAETVQLCGRYQIAEAYDQYDRMVCSSKIDTVYVAVPNFLHYRFAKQALENGKNVIVENL